MADPFSIAGSAVGVVALGLEVCKGLVSYIGQVKDEKQEVSQIADRLEQLADILEKLKITLNELEPTADGSTLLPNAGLLACSSALNNIRLKLQPSISGSQTQGVRQSVRYWKSKLAYPFRRVDLLFLKQIVEDVQQNLHTALIALLLYVLLDHSLLKCLYVHHSDQQLVNHVRTTQQLSTLSQTIHLGASAIEHHVAAMQPEIADILALARPVATEIPHISTTLSAMASSLKELV
jgi:hypothetical protein